MIKALLKFHLMRINYPQDNLNAICCTEGVFLTVLIELSAQTLKTQSNIISDEKTLLILSLKCDYFPGV